MCLRLAIEAVPLDAARKSASLGGAGHIDQLTRCKEIRAELLSDLVAVQLFFLERNLAQVTYCRHTVDLEVLQLTLAQSLWLDVAKANLNCRIPVYVFGLFLRDVARPDLDHSDRHDDSFVKDLRHADLSAH